MLLLFYVLNKEPYNINFQVSFPNMLGSCGKWSNPFQKGMRVIWAKYNAKKWYYTGGIVSVIPWYNESATPSSSD